MKTEPAVVVSLIAALIALAVGFGLDISEEQVALIMAPVAILAGLLIRSKVTPV
jgi:hypothetical protein